MFCVILLQHSFDWYEIILHDALSTIYRIITSNATAGSWLVSFLICWVFHSVQDCLINEISRHLVVFSASMLAEVDSRRTDAGSLSMWLAANLPLNDQLKLQLLGMQSPVKRLRSELSFLTKVCTIFIFTGCL